MTNSEKVRSYKAFVMSFNREDSLDWWLSNMNRPELQIYNEVNGKFSFRAFDDTPSVTIYDCLKYVDFGGDSEAKDPVSRIMEITELSFIPAVEMFLSWNDKNIVSDRIKWERVKDTKSEAAPYKPAYLRNMLINRKRYSNEYNLLRVELFRGCSLSDIKYAENVLHIGYEPKKDQWTDRIFLPEMDISGTAYGSYRYNRSEGKTPNGRKGLIRKNSKRVLYAEHMIPKFRDSVIYTEGHSDCVINISKRYSAITTGSSTKKFGTNITKLKGKTLYDFPDLDLAGLKGAMTRSVEIEIFNKTVDQHDKINHIIFWWADWIKSTKIFDKLTQNQVSKTDLYYSIQNVIPVKNNAAYLNLNTLVKIQKLICKNKKWDFEKLSILNWHVVFKEQFKVDGYDFADFYTDEQSLESTKLVSFLDSKVKF